MLNTDQAQLDLAMLTPEQAQAALRHVQALEEAAAVMLGRTVSYGLAWQRYGAKSNLLNAARKVERLMEMWWHATETPVVHKDALDDAIDAINYLAFFIQCARDGNLSGIGRELPADPCAEGLHLVAYGTIDCVVCGEVVA